MLIFVEQLNDSTINLDVYTYSEGEFNEVRDFYREYVIIFKETSLREDNLGRRGLRFITDIFNSKKLKETLHFEIKEGNLEFSYIGNPYKCRELTRNGDGRGCENILAESYSKARIICSMNIARNKGWFSSYPKEGQCEKRKWF